MSVLLPYPMSSSSNKLAEACLPTVTVSTSSVQHMMDDAAASSRLTLAMLLAAHCLRRQGIAQATSGKAVRNQKIAVVVLNAASWKSQASPRMDGEHFAIVG